ncbi:DEAD/DEAH box helicase [Bacillus massilinigeriensis]
MKSNKIPPFTPQKNNIYLNTDPTAELSYNTDHPNRDFYTKNQNQHPKKQLSFNKDLQKILLGKQLLQDDLPFSTSEIQAHQKAGYLLHRQGIITKNNTYHCIRCNNKDPQMFAAYPCARCQKECVYCRKCIMMGRVSKCTSLISWNGPNINNDHQPNLEWTGTLSPGQQAASTRVIEAIHQNKELLVWAVCGAGKTEVLFEGIHSALTDKKRVCIATPRTDVVLELAPRLQSVFPTIKVASLYGGSEDRHLYSQLTISTTHQLLRFYQAFDTIIIDEVDAFPYTADETLQYAVKQAKKPQSSTIYLTATPNEKYQQECRQKKRDFVTIPARYHRYPLPVPQFTWCGNWQKLLKKNKLPTNVTKWITERLINQKPMLLFAPQIDRMEKILPILQKLHPKIESVHAEDPNRKEKVQAMRNKEIPLLLTTTILSSSKRTSFPQTSLSGLQKGLSTKSLCSYLPHKSTEWKKSFPFFKSFIQKLNLFTPKTRTVKKRSKPCVIKKFPSY